MLRWESDFKQNLFFACAYNTAETYMNVGLFIMLNLRHELQPRGKKDVLSQDS